MTNGSEETVPAGLDGFDWRSSRGTRNLRTSNRIASFLTISVVLFAITAAGFAFWITREHNRLAASGSEQMIRGGMSALDEKLKTVSMDFAIWPDAVRALREDDAVWIWENIGISAAVTETTDIMMIVPANGQHSYGWVPGMDEKPSTTLLPDDVVNKMNQLTSTVPMQERRAVTAMHRGSDGIWLLSVARIVSDDPSEDPADDGLISRLIFGFKITDALLQELGQQYLISDLSLATSPEEGRDVIPLLGPSDEVLAYASWSPPRPGDLILRQIALPMVVALGTLTLIALISSNLLSRSARRLESAMRSAQEASRAKSDFIANVSHELRTPMNGVIGLSGLLRQSGLDDKQTRLVDMLQSSANTQMRLIGDLLDVNTIEHGRFNLNIAPFVPQKVVEGVCTMFEIEATGKGLELELKHSDSQGISVLGDPERFRQVCANLVSNAIKFTDTGKVTVDLKVRPRLGQAVVNLLVTDTGRGISKEDLRHVFDRFAQGTTRERGKASGNGLGLAIAKTIVDLMGGAISVDSTLGKGSQFRVEIGFETAGEEVPQADIAQRA